MLKIAAFYKIGGNVDLEIKAEIISEINLDGPIGNLAGFIGDRAILFEALILSIFGGIFGLILGYVFAFLVSIVTPFAPYISWEILALTLLTTLAVGIIFGIYPALKAASKNPIESLKHYR